MLKIKVKLFIEKDGAGFHAFCPDLPGLHVGGDTEEEAKKHAKDAVIAYVSSLIKHGDPIPLSITDPSESLWGFVKRIVANGSAKRFITELSVPLPEPAPA